MSPLLKSIELLYRGVNRGRRAWYRHGLGRAHALPRPVVSVGNIATGGGGKTPTVIAIANALEVRGLKVAILTRGFGGQLSGKVGQIVTAPFDPARFGDEPVLMARRVPGVDVVVGAKRWESGLAYLVQRDCQAFLLDDGFQHLQLHRDLDIVLDRPSSRWHREGPSALAAADIVLRRVDTPAEDGEWTARMVASSVRQSGTHREVEELLGKRVFVFSGLADNEQFVRTVADLGCRIVATRSFPDHHRYVESEIDEIRDEAERLRAIPITSEKDAVKLGDASVAVVEASMRIPSLDSIIERIVSLVRK